MCYNSQPMRFLIALLLSFIVFGGYLYWKLESITPIEQDVLAVVSSPKPTQKPLYQDNNFPNENNLFQIIQDWREKNGFLKYKKNDLVCDYAEKRLNEVLTKTGWSHKGFREGLPEFFYNKGYVLMGENLSDMGDRPESHLDAWLKSASHSANLKADFTYSCVKCKYGYCAHIFAK